MNDADVRAQGYVRAPSDESAEVVVRRSRPPLVVALVCVRRQMPPNAAARNEWVGLARERHKTSRKGYRNKGANACLQSTGLRASR